MHPCGMAENELCELIYCSYVVAQHRGVKPVTSGVSLEASIKRVMSRNSLNQLLES